MVKLRRGNLVFVTRASDHLPRHVHVYRDGTLILKWDLENDAAMIGVPTRRIREILREVQREGKL